MIIQSVSYFIYNGVITSTIFNKFMLQSQYIMYIIIVYNKIHKYGF